MRCVNKQFFPQGQNAQCDSPEERLRPNASDAPKAIRTIADSSARKALALFRQEAVQLRQLGQHAQIPALFDAFEETHYQYIVQEFIEGENLESLLKVSGRFSELQIVKLLKTLLPVLKFTHQHHVIHRDIKPANIIYQSVNDLPYLVDLGAAKQATGTALLYTGTVIGSAEYTAPEQARGKPIFASDIYSLGVTCIYLLTGVSPFSLYDTGDSQWVWRDFLKQPVHPDLARVLDKMIQMSTNRRYPSVAAVQDDLAAVDLERDVGRGLQRKQAQHPFARPTEIRLDTQAALPPNINRVHIQTCSLLYGKNSSFQAGCGLGMGFDSKLSPLDIVKPSSPKHLQKPLIEMLTVQSGDCLSRPQCPEKHAMTKVEPRSNLNRAVLFFGVLTLMVCAKLWIESVLFPLDSPGETIEQIDRDAPQGFSKSRADLGLTAATEDRGAASQP
ncbi:MAG: serine/threonine-protein kinase [Cyanobacteria bacterium P01_F01_bin.4]